MKPILDGGKLDVFVAAVIRAMPDATNDQLTEIMSEFGGLNDVPELINASDCKQDSVDEADK